MFFYKATKLRTVPFFMSLCYALDLCFRPISNVFDRQPVAVCYYEGSVFFFSDRCVPVLYKVVDEDNRLKCASFVPEKAAVSPLITGEDR